MYQATRETIRCLALVFAVVSLCLFAFGCQSGHSPLDPGVPPPRDETILLAWGIDGAIQLQWMPPPVEPNYPYGYNIYRSTVSTRLHEGPGSEFNPQNEGYFCGPEDSFRIKQMGLEKINIDPVTSTHYLDFSLENGEVYYYRIRLVQTAPWPPQEKPHWSNEAMTTATPDTFTRETDVLEPYEEPDFPGFTSRIAGRQLLIHYTEGAYSQVLGLMNASNSLAVGQIPDMDYIQAVVEDEFPLADEIAYFETQPFVIYTCPNYPTDADFYPKGEPDADKTPGAARRWHFDIINALDVWKLGVYGSPDVTVGIIDSGIDMDNFDDFGERIIHSADNDPPLTDASGHGSHVAGVIGAKGNGSGTLGMAWKVMLHPYNVERHDTARPTFFMDELIAVRRMVTDGCQVLNMSRGIQLQRDANEDGQFNGPGEYFAPAEHRPRMKAYTRYLELPIYSLCTGKDILLIRSAGNDYADGNFTDDIPIGHYRGGEWIVDYATMPDFRNAHGNVLFITATNKDDQYGWFSNRGPVQIIAAPGVNIWSAFSTDATKGPAAAKPLDGTSMAAALTSGLAALIRSADTKLSAAQTAAIILETAVDLVDLDPPVKRINAYAALLQTTGSTGLPSEGDLTVNIGTDPDSPGWVGATISTIMEFGQPVLDLTKKNFRLIEDGLEREDFVTELISGGSVTIGVDIACVIDVTGSMAGEITYVRIRVREFADFLATQELNVRLAGVPFRDYIDPVFDFTEDVEAFKIWAGALPATGGGDAPENDLDAIMTAHDQLSWRENAMHLMVVITDAPTHYKGDGSSFAHYTVKEVIDVLKVENFVLHSISPMNVGFHPDVSEIADATGGVALKMPVGGNIDLKVLPVIYSITSAYIMRWRDFDPAVSEHEIWIGAYRTPEDKSIYKLWKEFYDVVEY